MRRYSPSFLLALACFCPAGAQSATPTLDLNRYPPQPQETICGDIVDASNDPVDPYSWFYASDVIQCLTSVPFQADVATRFITFLNQTLQFQSTSAFLRDPPPSYQQPASDTFALLQNIQAQVDSGSYHNQYAFEADIQNLLLGAHDTHVGLYAGALSQFTFSAPFYLTSVSADGKQLPEVYDWDDLTVQSPQYPISPLKSIEGVPVATWLEQFARRQSFGMLEPDADWNQLMNTGTQMLVGGANVLSGGATFYPGDELVVEYQNGTNVTWYWLALYNSPGFTGPLQTGGDFYNFFVLGLEPANWEETYADYTAQLPPEEQSTPSQQPEADSNRTSWHEVVPAYPADTIVHQDSLGLYSSGYVTGYYMKDVSTAVLSIPTFDAYGDGALSFDDAIVKFINRAGDRNASKAIIDLRQNGGGLEALAFDLYQAIFPSQGKPVITSRMRSQPLGNTLGNTITTHFQGLQYSDRGYEDLVESEWVVTDRINYATGRNFTSWSEFYGPISYNQDDFSLIQQYNLSSEVFDLNALGVDFVDCYYNDTCPTPQDTWAPSDIILLTDGTCGSTCALFVDLMTKVGVWTVVVGGRPQHGPMQAASGSRGARAYSTDDIDNDFYTAQDIDSAATDRYETDTGIYLSSAGVNLRDQIRPQENGVPNQFLYLPADCRIFWTLANINDYDRLWHDVWNAIYNDTSLCIPGSTNASAPASPNTRKRSEDTSEHSVATYIAGGLLEDGFDPENPIFGYTDDNAPAPKPITFCTNSTGQPDVSMCKLQGYTCRTFDFTCSKPKCKGRNCPKPSSSGNTGYVRKNICAPQCKVISDSTGSDRCSSYQTCVPDVSLNGNSNAFLNDRSSQAVTGPKIQTGRCFPYVDPQTQCSALQTNQGLQNHVGRRMVKKKRR